MKTREAFEQQTVKLLQTSLSDVQRTAPYAVMLTGGTTSQAIYRRMAQNPFPVHPGVRIVLSDERYVPPGNSAHNLTHIRPLLTALQIPHSRIIAPNTTLPPDACVQDLNKSLQPISTRDLPLTLAVLGLGTDGHLASLFSDEDLMTETGQAARFVPRPVPPGRISVTREILMCSQRIVFVVAGPKKQPIIDALANTPQRVLAARALRGHPHIEVWYCPEAPKAPA